MSSINIVDIAKSQKSNFIKDIDHYGTIISEVSSFFSSPQALRSNKNRLYVYRQELISKKGKLLIEQSLYVKYLHKVERDRMHSMKIGKLPPGDQDYGIVYKSEGERKIYLDSYTKDLRYLIQIMTDYINFVSDTVDTIDKMLLGVKYYIELDK